MSDEEEILNHIHRIFKSFLEQDRKAIKKAHTDDWVGFLLPSTKIERGIDDYMEKVEHSLKNFRGTGFEIIDNEIQIHGDLAVVYYIARYDFADDDGKSHSIPLRSIDIYIRKDGGWIQAGSHIGMIPTD